MRFRVWLGREIGEQGADFRAGLRLTACLIVPLVLAQAVVGQIPIPAKPEATPAAVQSPPPDPLGRTTPRGTIAEFIHAVRREDFVSAARYMQLTDQQQPRTELLARDLTDLLDRYLTEPLTNISDLPTGSLSDALALDHERVGPLTISGRRFDVILVRVNRPEAGRIWLISSATLDQVPAMHEMIERTFLEKVMPESFFQNRVFGVALAKWIGWGASLGIPFLLLWLCSRLVAILLSKISDPERRTLAEYFNARVRWPGIFVLTLIIHSLLVFFAGFSIAFRTTYLRVVLVVLVVCTAWLMRRVFVLLLERTRITVRRRGQPGTASLILLIERLFNAIIVVVAIFLILTIAGVDTKTALAGVGIGGVALAFGAQKTVENVLGGIFLITDKALAVGDTCCISNRMGTVEDITLRSVRLRTLEQSLLSIPAGALSQSSIENFATQSKILIQTNLHLRYATTVQQLNSVLEGIGKLLAGNSKIEPTTARIRLIGFGERSINLELFAYVLTCDNLEFLRVRQNLLLEIGNVIESSGSGFAMPTQFIYLDRPLDQSNRKEQSKEADETDIRKAG
ncbi:MAG TPA: mechanosensitive ion channel family protein [Terriglobales bacterium]